MTALPLQVSAVEDTLLQRMFVPGGLRDELTRARNFYMLTTGAQPRHRSAKGNIRSSTSCDRICKVLTCHQKGGLRSWIHRRFHFQTSELI